jgi:hypothetical protein
MKFLKLFSLMLVLAAGCSVFPGLQVLTGENPDGNAVTVDNADIADMVMADKTGATNPSLMSAADRIEAAVLNADIIEIRKDEVNDAFVVDMLFLTPQDADPNTQAGLIALYEAWRQAVEFTWQGTLAESDGTDQVQVNILRPGVIDTLDRGTSFYGTVTVNATIDRSDMLRYLAGSRNLTNFYDMILDGTLTWEFPQEPRFYEGQPNHPMYMLSQLQAMVQQPEPSQ